MRGGVTGEAQSFESVLAAAQVGAAWACALIWSEHAPAVAAFLRARGSREPEDLTSEVFLAVFQSLDQFVGAESEFRSFVFSVAYRRLVDELRKRSRRGEHAQWSAEGDTRRSASAEEAALTRMGDAVAMSLLDGLTEDQRNVMVLRVIADLTVDEVAGILGKNSGTVKALQRRALESLRKKVSRDRTLLSH
jgi:RNA polymerase sigma-70 factor (ECF subfamily)